MANERLGDDLLRQADFHHIGYACRSIRAERQSFEAWGFALEGDPFVDVTQGIAGCFMVGAGPRIELLENLPERSTLTPWLDAGIKMYHLAYEVSDLEMITEWVRRHRGRVVIPPVPATAFAGRRVSFAMMRNGPMLEFIEKPAIRRLASAND